MGTQYRTKKERRARRKIMLTLTMEYEEAIRSMLSTYVYSGDAYPHQLEKLDRINARIREIYLVDTKD
jgi:hypothetical protein